MRRIISLSMLFLCISMASTQAQKKKHAFYATGALNFGNYFGGDLNLNYVLKEKYSFKIGYTGNIRTAKSRPEDFETGFFGLFDYPPTLFWYPYAYVYLLDGPFDIIVNYRFDAGRIYKLNPSGTVRINAAVGLGYTTFTEPVNWEKHNSLLGLFGNYSWNYKSRNTISLIINPKIEFALTKVFGFTISPMVQMNEYRTYFGIGMGIMLGVLR